MKKEIYETKNYSMFKKLLGNRGTSPRRIQKIKKSILDVGYITNPILVNEKMEIIDGQGRFEALKELCMPIEYIVEPGIGVKECISMNIFQTNWSCKDYVDSYAAKGLQSYIYIAKLQEEFPLLSSLELINTALLGKSRLSSDEIRNGSLIVTEEQYQNAKKKLARVYPLVVEYKDVRRIQILVKGIIQCYPLPGIDIEKLIDKVLNVLESNSIPPISTDQGIMQYLEEVYNKGRKGEYIYIFTEYRKQAELRLKHKKYDI